MRQHRSIAGFALIETMVTVVIVAFGLLGIAGLISRAFVTEVEGTQRTQAMLLLQDMASRIEANRGNVAAYVTGDNAITGYTGTTLNVCAGGMSAARDLCEWGRMLAGANEQVGARNAGVLVGARGCVYEIDAFSRLYTIAIAWEGMTAGPPPLPSAGFAPNGCGENMLGAANENRRRVMTLQMRLGNVGA